MKICAYVLSQNAKSNYANESYNVRMNAGMAVVIDILKNAGYEVEYAGEASVANYDIVLVSITSDCDWWPFISERVNWRDGNYKVVAGGAGVLNARPLLGVVDYFVLGRAEGAIVQLLEYIGGESSLPKSVIESASFDIGKKYYVNQVGELYHNEIMLESGHVYKEGSIGCPHKCLFCSYTWHRKLVGDEFVYGDLWAKNKQVELPLLDVLERRGEINFTKLRTTAIDGLSERLRYRVNKRISDEDVKDMLRLLATRGKPHQVKFYNIVGYPSEDEEEWFSFLECIKTVDSEMEKKEKQVSILLHSTPFRPMPATPMACEPMSYKNYRGRIAKVLGKGLYKGNIFYQGNAMWAVESMGTEALSTVILSAIMIRGTEEDARNIERIATSARFWRANTRVKQATLEKYFDVDRLFGSFDTDTLPTRYLKTYAKVERMQK